ncbi:MAG TPA: sigma-70 family RNA polymerase sigma factor [Spirochaetia bacterium]|nr:sigma-70 family RNA polymerase sigma factor [Spirochaetia bacterium]
MTDGEIIERVQGGQTRHFAELVRRYQDPVYAMALRFLGSPGDAEDTAQEVFLRAFRGLSSFKGEARFSTWLYRITFNLCTDSLRRRKRLDGVTLDRADLVADDRVDVEDGLLSAEARSRVRQCLDTLDERYRTVVVMLYYQKLSYEQISQVLGVPLKTVETRLYRARKLLRDSLERAERQPAAPGEIPTGGRR